MGTIKQILERLYKEYVHDVSDKGAAIPWQTVELLLDLLHEVPPDKLCIDLGSGFSSVVLRAWKKYEDDTIDIVSVDTSELWLERSWDFLEAHDLCTDDLILWEECMSRYIDLKEGREPALVVLDIDYTRNRSPYTKHVLKRLCGEHTVLLVDDMHKAHYRENVIAVFKRDLKHFEVKQYDELKDELGRYPAVVTNMVLK